MAKNRKPVGKKGSLAEATNWQPQLHEDGRGKRLWARLIEECLLMLCNVLCHIFNGAALSVLVAINLYYLLSARRDVILNTVHQRQ